YGDIEGMNVESVRWNSVSIGAVEVTCNLKAKLRMQQPLYSCGFAHGVKRLSMTSIASWYWSVHAVRC
ncbi:MAG: hypothetical protein ACRC7Q_12155, partial [Plesiomonas shigelloides]